MQDLRRSVMAAAVGGLAALVLVGAGSLVLHSSGIQFPDDTFQSTAAPRDGRRAYYRTLSTYSGAGTLAACADGYHFASIWEIADPSSLRYASEEPDADPPRSTGTGPPSGGGWVRTGDDSQSTKMVGSNCSNWMGGGWGTYADLPGEPLIPNPSSSFVVIFGVWEVTPQSCDPRQVWCVEDSQ